MKQDFGLELYLEEIQDKSVRKCISSFRISTHRYQVFLWLSLLSHYRVTDEAFLAETSKYGPSTFLQMCSLLLKKRTFEFLFAFTAAGVVQCGGRKTSPHTSTIVQFIFHFVLGDQRTYSEK